MARYDVFGMCNPLVDLQAEVSDDLISLFGLAKGGMFLVDREQHGRLLPQVADRIVNREPGGSGANTMIGLAQLGAKTVYTGCVGDDDLGATYSEGLRNIGVKTNLSYGELPTGLCLVLLSPDAERTMCTYLGSCLELGPEDVNLEDLSQSSYAYITGYLWDTPRQKEAVLAALEGAKKAEVPVAFSLSDPFCVGRHREDFLDLIERYVSIVFANQEEALGITGASTEAEAAKILAEKCDIVAVTLGGDGSLVATKDQLDWIAPHQVRALDTTGAGDMYAAGFLFGMTRGYELARCGALAGRLAAEVVANLGPRLSTISGELRQASL